MLISGSAIGRIGIRTHPFAQPTGRLRLVKLPFASEAL
jgi:hypothetical protein